MKKAQRAMVGGIAYRPLALGLLSGKYHNANRPTNRVRATAPLFLAQNFERVSSLIGALREVADAHSATPAQVALAWVIRNSAVAAIPGASSVEQLESNVAADDLELTNDEYIPLRSRQRSSAHPWAGNHNPANPRHVGSLTNPQINHACVG